MKVPKPDGADAASRDISVQMAALAHPARIEILRHLSCTDHCCCKDVVGQLALAQSTVSQHLKILVEAGLVHFEPHRQRSHYSLDRTALAALSGEIASLVASCCGSPPGAPHDAGCGGGARKKQRK